MTIERTQAATPLHVVDPPSPAAAATPEPEEINLRVLKPLLDYVAAELGGEPLETLLAETGLRADSVNRTDQWISVERFEHVLRWIRERVDNDAEFMRACAYRLREAYGPMSLVIRVINVRRVFEMLCKTSSMATKVARMEIVQGGRNLVRIRYTSDHTESRLMCLSRLSQQKNIVAAWWGLPPARVEEHSCIAKGDAACEYTLQWYDPLQFTGLVAGGLLGAVAAVLLPASMVDPVLGAVLLPVLGAAAGILYEGRRLLKTYYQYSRDNAEEAEQLLTDHARAVTEVLALHEREREWSRRLHDSIAAQSTQLEAVLDQIEAPAAPKPPGQSVTSLRALSHDLGNPLTVLQTSLSVLMAVESLLPDEREFVRSADAASRRVAALVTELGRIARAESTSTEPTYSSVDVLPMAGQIRRQLRATLAGRDVSVSVFHNRESPERIETDALLLGRIIDNIVTNASKYTERGSIVVEIGGTPGFLVLKVSDTGRGIGPGRLEQVFLGGGKDPNPMVGESHGHGLAIVVRLLDQLGGRLEIMSTPNVGTTIWVYVPTSPPGREPEAPPRAEGDAGLQARVRRVVKIRPSIESV